MYIFKDKIFTSIVSSTASNRSSQKCKSESYVRKRSSSLPRILPPIFDDDVDDEVDCAFVEDGSTVCSKNKLRIYFFILFQ